MQAYLIHTNAKLAAEQAGYSMRTAYSTGQRLLKKFPEVAKAVKDGLERLAWKAEVKAERILREEGTIAFSDIAKIFNGKTLISPDKLPEDVRRSISSIKQTVRTDKNLATETTYEYRFWDKGRALERLSKHLGLYKEDNEQKGIKLQDVISALPEDFRDGVCRELNKLISSR